MLNLQPLVVIFSEHISSPRLQYILNELFTRRLGVSFRLTDSKEELDARNEIRINYSHIDIPGCIQIRPHGLLDETEIVSHAIRVKYDAVWDSVFFEQASPVPFDLFSASFYLLSRYEEYLPHQVDEHGRFHHDQSLAVQYGFIDTPLIDKWVLQLKKHLEEQFSMQIGTVSAFECISTVDIDVAYLYKGIPIQKQLLKLAKSVVLLRFKQAIEQLLVRFFHHKDPYDTYGYIKKITRTAKLCYFVLVGGKSEYDEALDINGVEMQSLLQSLRKENIYIHPSYLSFDKPELIAEEIHILEQITGAKILHSRQHFLNFRLPETLIFLSRQGISHDYSMVYSGIAGFRASTCHPFFFYDLEENKPTSLVLEPTCVMDVTLRYNMGLSVHSANNKIEQLMQEVKQVNGKFISIWHNSNLSNTDGWLPWREVFEKIHILAAK